MNLKQVYRRICIASNIGLAIILIGSLMGVFIGERSPVLFASLILIIVGFLVAIVAVIYSQLRLRCPHCDTPLRFRGSKPNFCPVCGEKLDW